MGAIKTAIRKWMARRKRESVLQDELEAWRTLQLWGLTPAAVEEFIRKQQRRIHRTQNVEAELRAMMHSAHEQRLLAMDLQMQVAVLETEVTRLRTSLALTGGGIA